MKTARVWESVDVLLLPTAPTIYRIEEVHADPIRLNTNLGYYTNFVNLLDLAAVAIPAGFRPHRPALRREPDRTLAIGLGLARVSGSQRRGASRRRWRAPHRTTLNRQLTDRRGRLTKSCKTARDYRLYALANTTPPKPGLLREPGFEGPGIDVEVWSLPARSFGSFVALIPPPLGIGSIVLDDASTELGFICEPAGLAGACEITAFGGWVRWRSAHKS